MRNENNILGINHKVKITAKCADENQSPNHKEIIGLHSQIQKSSKK